MKGRRLFFRCDAARPPLPALSGTLLADLRSRCHRAASVSSFQQRRHQNLSGLGLVGDARRQYYVLAEEVLRLLRPPRCPTKCAASLALRGAPSEDVFVCHRDLGVDMSLLPQVRGQPSAAVPVHPGLQPWELPAHAMPGQGGQALIVAQGPDQAHQDRWTFGAACQEVGVSTGGGSRTQRSMAACAGAYRLAPFSTRVTNILEVIRGEEK